MARIETGAGVIPKITATRAKDQSTTTSAIASLFSAINTIIDVLNGRLSFGDGTSYSRTGNFDGQEIEYTTPSGANTEFAVRHDLGRIPVRVEVVRKDRAADVYDSSPGSWTREVIYLKCNVASAVVLLRIS